MLKEALNREKGRWPIAWVLTAAIAGLVGLALAAALTVQFVAGRRATNDLFQAKADLLVDLIAARVREQLDPASAQLSFIAEVLAQPAMNYGRSRIADLMTGALAAAPQIQRLLFVYPDGKAITVVRGMDGPSVSFPDLAGNPDVMAGVAEANRNVGGRWGELVFVPGEQGPSVNRRHSVWRDGVFVGGLGAIVPVRQLSAMIENSVADEYAGTPFILYGDESVLAHRRLLQPVDGLSPARPLPRLDEVDDPVLASIWSGRRRAAPVFPQTDGSRAVDVDGTAYLFLSTVLPEFGPVPFRAGAHFRLSDIADDVRTMVLAGLAGLGVLVAALVVAVLLARRLAQPTRRFAAAAARLADLDFEGAERLPRSRVKELDEQALAFNRMIDALRWFEAYVPRKLVRQLARGSGRGGIASATREVTVMFTDIVGFTSRSENMSPEATAEMLNAHFAHVIAAVETTGGTVDKFMGDGVMAFWGAPDVHVGHARAALAAARAIAGGPMPGGIRLRVGLHTGTVVAGNVGSRERLNYTILGDAVNVTQRIEQLGHALMLEEETCCVLVSRSTWEAAGRPADFVPAGEFSLRGRGGEVEVYRLSPNAGAPPGP